MTAEHRIALERLERPVGKHFRIERCSPTGNHRTRRVFPHRFDECETVDVGMHILGDEEINAYIDGMLDAERAFAVAEELALQPREAARAASYRALNDALKLLFDHVLRQPVPERMRVILHRHRNRAAQRRMALSVASAAVTLLLAGLGGQALEQHLGLFDAAARRPPSPAWHDAGRIVWL